MGKKNTLERMLSDFDDGNARSRLGNVRAGYKVKAAKQLLNAIAMEFCADSTGSYGLLLRMFRERNMLSLLMDEARTHYTLACFVCSVLGRIRSKLMEDGEKLDAVVSVDDRLYLGIETTRMLCTVHEIRRSMNPFWMARDAVVKRLNQPEHLCAF